VRGQRVSRTSLKDGDVLELGQSFFLFRDRVPSKRTLAIAQTWTALEAPRPQLVTFLGPLAESFDHLAKVAPTSVPVMILGESGTGKELAARAVHELSGRRGAFVAVNCGAIPEHLVESELFGAMKGAYSGATEDRIGLIRAAHGGTLFLDEIGDLPEASQVAFLRVLQQREVVPVGGTSPVHVDFRLVVATHRDLEAAVERGDFREDLLARIAGLSVRLPPLRDRREDLGILMARLLAKAPSVAFTPKAARALLGHDFPQNVRELERALELSVALSGGKPIEIAHLPEAIRDGQEKSGDLEAPADPMPALEPEDEERKKELVALLEKHAGNVAAVARDMGKARMQIHRWLRRYGINPSAFR
jgi:DNA-binding NtrC family response regulator